MVVMDVLHTFLRAVPGVSVKDALDVLIYERVEVAVRRCVGEDVDGIWVKLKAKVGGDEHEYLIPVFSIKYVRKLASASQGSRR
ncbi:MAG: hypothetical protein LM558_05185 [Thermosphaera sp.]|nr:hypothetical protein [Thermosphaera sp.]